MPLSKNGCERQVQPPSKRRRTMRHTGFNVLPTEIVDKILMHMATSHNGLGVIKLSLTSRQNRKSVEANLDVWYQLYLHWRGPIRTSRTYRTPRGMVTLRPTYPTSVPNFRPKAPPITWVMLAPCLLE